MTGFCTLLLVFSILILIAGCIFLHTAAEQIKNVKTINEEVDTLNTKIQIENQSLQKEKDNLLKQINDLSISQNQLNIQIKDFDENFKKHQELAKQAFENYCEVLDRDYEEKEKEYDNSIEKIKESYENLQLSAIKELDKIKEDLDKIKATKAAVLQAQLKEQEIKEKREFYMLCPKTADLKDIKKLENLKLELNNPRILSMLIWSTYFQKPMNTLCNNVLGTSIVTGIYKITNQENDMCYIGQAADVATRWKQHAKCGLGIDTPAGNKLYQAMQDYGIWNFSWELLEECSREDLNEKEKYYINLYDSYSYGYNSNKGISS